MEQQMKHIIPISGKDSLATAIIQKQRNPSVDYEYIFNPVGFELPETLEWLDKVKTSLGIEITFIGQDLRLTEEWLSGFRPNINSRYCTRLGKIEPTEEYFEGEGFIYYGLRADEPERIGYVNKGKSELIAVYPLREESLGLNEVLKICNDSGLKPPTFRWDILEKEFTRRLGSDFIYNTFNEWQIDQLFAGRSRANCYNCFFMRRYEWVWLLETHPEFYWKQAEDEEVKDERIEIFYTIKDLPLRKLAEQKDEIVERHIDKTVNQIRKLQQLKLFDAAAFFQDMLSLTSCGLLCGK